jgi:hypothetical protein
MIRLVLAPEMHTTKPWRTLQSKEECKNRSSKMGRRLCLAIYVGKLGIEKRYRIDQSSRLPPFLTCLVKQIPRVSICVQLGREGIFSSLVTLRCLLPLELCGESELLEVGWPNRRRLDQNRGHYNWENMIIPCHTQGDPVSFGFQAILPR